MYKIPTLFERDATTRKIVPKWNPAIDLFELGLSQATEKIDGTAVRIWGGRLYARHTLKHGDTAPGGWEPDGEGVQAQRPGWVPCRREDPQHKWHWEAWDNVGLKSYGSRGAAQPPSAHYTWLPDGTYELVGPKVQGNAYELQHHQLWLHGETKVLLSELSADAGVSFGYLEGLLRHAPIEGLVWWYRDKAIAKIKARDYGIPWPRARSPRPVASASTGA